VRLCFHDAVTWDPQTYTGGNRAWASVRCARPNQCERTLDANKGLPDVADYLDQLWSQHGWNKVISRPDWWSLAGKVAIEWASGGTCKIRWGYGRTEASQIAAWPDRHPLPPEGYMGVKNHMVDRLGFSWEEAVALLGAHCLGETHLENSGYHGRWVPSPANYFSNSFYNNLLQYDWYPTVVSCNSTYNNAGCNMEYITDDLAGSVMLLTDAVTQYTVKDNQCTLTSHKKSNLYQHRCPMAKSLQPYVRHFAQDNGYWLQSFASAWEKLQNFGPDQIYYNSDQDVQYDLSYTHWQGYTGWYQNRNDYGYLYNH